MATTTLTPQQATELGLSEVGQMIEITVEEVTPDGGCIVSTPDMEEEVPAEMPEVVRRSISTTTAAPAAAAGPYAAPA